MSKYETIGIVGIDYEYSSSTEAGYQAVGKEIGMKRKRYSLILIITLLLVTHYSVFALTKHYYQSAFQQTLMIENSLKTNKIEHIEKELSDETIIVRDQQDAYDQIEKRGDKTFLYGNDGSMLIKNQEVIIYKWTDPLDSNKYYQNIKECFQKYFSDHQSEIDFSSLSKYGFVPEVAACGFSVYPDTEENYHAYANFYVNKRLALELVLEMFKNEESTVEAVNIAYGEYVKAKQMLSQYILSVIPGDL